MPVAVIEVETIKAATLARRIVCIVENRFCCVPRV